MLSERDIRLGNTVAQTAVHHRFRAASNLFRRLEQRDKGPAPGLRSLGEKFGSAEQTRLMRVMAASICYADCVPRVIYCGECRSVGQSRIFPHGKCVHVSSRQYGLAFTIT